MTDHRVARLYVLVLAVLVFFLAWALVAAHPWQARRAAADPRQLALLGELRSRVQAESLRVQRVLDRRFAAYQGALAERRRTIALLEALGARRPSPAAAPAPVPAIAAPVVAAPVVATTRTS